MKFAAFNVLYLLRTFYTNNIKNDLLVLLKISDLVCTKVRRTKDQIRDIMISHIKLNEIKKLSDSVTLKTTDQGFEFIIIDHQNFDAAFTLHGGHLIHFQRKHQRPLIYLSKTAAFNNSKAIRGGVPICWPWFGKPNQEFAEPLPSHGFARISKWKVTCINEDNQGVNIDFSLASSEASKQLWKHDFQLTLKASLSDFIELSLVTENTGSSSFTYSGALHTYLHIANTEQANIEGLAEDYTDSLDAGKSKKSPTLLTINAELDAIHQVNQGDLMVNDGGNQRKIMVTNSGNDSVVVWNPWINKAASFADMPDDGYQTMLCIESAITGQNGVLVEAGQAHTLSTTIKETAMK